jgi:hypothetical protein
MYQTGLAISQECKHDTILLVFLQLRPRQAKSPHIIAQALAIVVTFFVQSRLTQKVLCNAGPKMRKARSSGEFRAFLLAFKRNIRLGCWSC